MLLDPAAFQAFEHAGWERAAEYYASAFGHLTAQTAEPLLDGVRVHAGSRVLDEACGPGFVASLAASRGASVVGLDFSSAMVAEATRRYPGVMFREGDVEALPFDSQSFDAVVMNFGMLHLAQPERAVAEARRVLRPNGRFAFTVWAAPEQAVGFGIVLQAIEAYGRSDVPLPQGPPFFRFSSADECQATLEHGGFSEVTVRTLPLVWTVSSPDGVFEALSKGGVRTAAILAAQAPDALAAIRDAARRGIEAYRCGEGSYQVPMPAVLSAATRA